MLTIHTDIGDTAVVLIHEVTSQQDSTQINNTNLGFRSRHKMIQNKLQSIDSLTVHINIVDLFLLIDVNTDDIALDVSE